MSSPSIIVVGSINTDLVIQGPRLPRPGETVLGGTFFRAGGGKGANQAVAAARAATSPVALVAAVGEDDFGSQALEDLGRENLDGRFIRTVGDTPSGVALIMVDAGGENAISVASGANLFLGPQDVEHLPEDLFTSARVLLTCCESPLETVVAALHRGRAHGLTTVLNPAPADAGLLETGCLELVDVLTPNAIEAAMLAGLQVATDADSLPDQAERAARQLQKAGAGAVVVTLGAAGCLVCDSSVEHLPAYRVEPVDATAAGDAFNGALAVALAEGQPLCDAANFAMQAAAIAVTRAGAQPSLPRRSEIDSFAAGGAES